MCIQNIWCCCCCYLDEYNNKNGFNNDVILISPPHSVCAFFSSFILTLMTFGIRSFVLFCSFYSSSWRYYTKNQIKSSKHCQKNERWQTFLISRSLFDRLKLVFMLIWSKSFRANIFPPRASWIKKKSYRRFVVARLNLKRNKEFSVKSKETYDRRKIMTYLAIV